MWSIWDLGHKIWTELGDKPLVVDNLISVEKPMLSREWVAKKILEISDTEWDNNQELLVAEEAAGLGGTDEDGGTESVAG